MPPWAEGRVVAGKYRLETRLGRGGMGEVWRAEHLVLHAPVAIKFINPGLSHSQEVTTRFMREARAAAALRSVHVVQILDYGVDDRTPYMVLEYLEGESLDDRLKRGPLSPAETAQVVNHIARAIGRAHELGIIHRDLKPANVYLVPTGDEIVAKVLDFGIAKMRGRDSAVAGPTRTGDVIGTPHYMSPEQAEGSPSIDHRSDLWALGVIAFQCLLGRRPFDSKDFGELLLQIVAHPIPRPSQLGPVPPGFDEWFARSVQRDPAERFQSAKDSADALRALCGATIAASTAPTPATAPTPSIAPQAEPTPAPVSATLVDRASTVSPTRPLLPILLGMALLLATALGVGLTLLALRGRGAAGPTPSASAPASAAQPEAPLAASEPRAEVVLPPPSEPPPPASTATIAANPKPPAPRTAETKTPQPAAKPSSKPSPSAKPPPTPPTAGTVRPEDLL